MNELRQTNLLFIMFDDLRPQLSIYGQSYMITPNFERLAKRSVVFDFVYSQVSVCNPSRDSLLTGLRPDTVGTYNFQHSHRGHMLLPIQLARSRYNTAGIGKILHFGCNNPKIWTFDRWDDNWYAYQDYERRFLNSSVTPDQWRPIDWFRDYKFVNRTIITLKNLVQKRNYFMLAMGFKLPHLTLHVPFKYFQLYDNDKARNAWKLSKNELTFPINSPIISYRCCNDKRFEFIRQNGSAKSIKSIPIGNLQSPSAMYDELMMGYSAAISFVDAQLGRILDVIDELELWNNLTIVLTADHGMHNGEKGMWEKWTLFDEATRVPLLIAHPQSPFHGQHYPLPVELLDIYPTVLDLLHIPGQRAPKPFKGFKPYPLQGKSLAPIILGNRLWNQQQSSRRDPVVPVLQSQRDSRSMPLLLQDFAVSQVLKCSPSFPTTTTTTGLDLQQWKDCDLRLSHHTHEQALMGYALRTPQFKYIAYFPFNRSSWKVQLLQPSLQLQELYDHRNESTSELSHREIINLVQHPDYKNIVNQLKRQLVEFIDQKILFRKRPFGGE